MSTMSDDTNPICADCGQPILRHQLRIERDGNRWHADHGPYAVTRPVADCVPRHVVGLGYVSPWQSP